jgi:hypothetical protein
MAIFNSYVSLPEGTQVNKATREMSLGYSDLGLKDSPLNLTIRIGKIVLN